MFGQIAKQHPKQLLVTALCLTFVLLSTPPAHAQESSPLAAPLITTPTPPPPAAAPTATLAVIVVAPADATPAVSGEPPLDNPPIAPQFAAAPEPSSFWPLAVQIFEAAVRSLAWLWFACGSLVFFVTAGIFAGLGLQRRPRGRYALLALPGGNAFDNLAVDKPDEFEWQNFALSENRPLADKEFVDGGREIKAPPRTSASTPVGKPTAADDYWPASLP